jgi:tetratricopeptide (TPR) repeat protein
VFSRTRQLVVLLFVTLLFLGCSQKELPIQKDTKLFEHEDEYILHAIEFTRLGDYEQSSRLYHLLFEKTDKYEYLLRALRFDLELKAFEKVKYNSFKYLKEGIDEYEELYRIYIVALLNLDEHDEALKHAKQLLGNIYYVKKDFYSASTYFESAYSLNNQSNTLLTLVNVLYGFINEKQKAISYLETHIRLKGCDDGVCIKLLNIYEEQQNIDGIVSILKRLYEKFKQEENFTAMIKSYNMLIEYLEQYDLYQAIAFLEQNHIDDIKLMSLYKRANELDKALILAKKSYALNKNIDMLAQIAILEFENASDKKAVLKTVIEKFEAVLAVLDNHIYQNYLGYLLIDYDINIAQGIILVKKALEKAPNNLAYIDSLAWGLYKQKKCQEAYVQMKKVVDAIGLNDEEIQLHWKKIKECSKQ